MSFCFDLVLFECSDAIDGGGPGAERVEQVAVDLAEAIVRHVYQELPVARSNVVRLKGRL